MKGDLLWYNKGLLDLNFESLSKTMTDREQMLYWLGFEDRFNEDGFPKEEDEV